MGNRPATTEEINKFLEEDNQRNLQTIKDLKSKMYDIESELHKYKTAYKMLVKELSEKK